MRILISGATGCIGSRLARALAGVPGLDLTLQVRRAAALPPDLRAGPGRAIISADLSAPADWLGQVVRYDQAVLTAAAWGGPAATAVNRDGTLALMGRLAEQGCPRIYYLSTASLLDAERRPRAALAPQGSDYIRSKFALLAALALVPWRARVTVLYPTLVLSERHAEPAAAVARLLESAYPYLRWICRLRADTCFHYVHADDLAVLLAGWLLKGLPAGLPDPIVLGSPRQSLAAILAGCQRALGQNPRRHLRIGPGAFLRLARLCGVRLSPWDRYCIRHPDFCHDRVVTPADFGVATRIPSALEYLEQWLQDAR